MPPNGSDSNVQPCRTKFAGSASRRHITRIRDDVSQNYPGINERRIIIPDALRAVGVEIMTEKRDRERVMAEITLSHLLRLAAVQGCAVSREQAMAFLNQDGRAFEMWKQMMQAAEDFIKCSLLQQSVKRAAFR